MSVNKPRLEWCKYNQKYRLSMAPLPPFPTVGQRAHRIRVQMICEQLNMENRKRSPMEIRLLLARPYSGKSMLQQAMVREALHRVGDIRRRLDQS